MSTATVESVEEIKEEGKPEVQKRGRKAGQKLFGHDKLFNTKEECEENEPYYSNEVTKTTKDKDGKDVETTSYEGEFDAEGFRIYKVIDKSTKEEESKFCWARSGDGALAN